MSTADLLGLDDEDPDNMGRASWPTTHPTTPSVRTISEPAFRDRALLVEFLRDGKLVYNLPDIEAIRKQRIADAHGSTPACAA